ncbi:tetratricopeptide (TPR) repeat protein [Bradyrhizobium ottawaense]|uniref:Tetratricopeptide (TPR) repeat protein n=1 Tax=Bradyrhizobium ottawaense TaxID=931866 RepID=A0ABV4FNT0_9BRAD
MADIFVSYTSRDRDWAFWIGQELERLGHTPRLHEWEISGGGDISRWMEETHNSADHILCVVSTAYVKAPYSSWERRAAQWVATTIRPNFLLPVFVEPCEPPTLLAPIKRCDLHGLDETAARLRLAEFMKPAAKPAGPVPFPLDRTAAAILGEGYPHAFPGGTNSAEESGHDSETELLLEQSVRPRPPALMALPRYLGSHEFVGRELELQNLSDWCGGADPSPMLLLEAIGGSGKSMLTWEWLTKHARSARSDWAGLFWYSFYERGAVMADFCCHALVYMTQKPIAQFRRMRPKILGEYLVGELQQRPWLVVLDGLERVLVAYHRHDAAQVLDADAAFAVDQMSGRDPCAAIRSDDDELLRRLVAAGPSKIVVSSRLTPRALMNSSHVAVPGVRRQILTGLRPVDAEAMIRRCGVVGDSQAIRAYLQQNCDCHPLVVGALAGLINDYPYDRGNFDRWVRDLNGGMALDLGKLDLVKRQNHILLAAIDALSPNSRRLLHLLSILQSAVDFKTLEGLSLDREAPAHPSGGIGDPEMKSSDRPSLRDIVAIVRDIEKRGLLQYDAAEKRYDLHPVVRGVAAAQLAHEETRQLGQNVVDYFTSKPHDPWDKVDTLEGVADGIQVVSAFVRMRRYSEAFQALEGDLANALYFNLRAHAEILSLVRGFFPGGWDEEPVLSDPAECWYLLNLTAASMSPTSEQKAQELFQRAIVVSLEASIIGSLYISLVGLAGALDERSREADITRLCSLASELAQVSRDPELVFMWKLREYKHSIVRGDWQSAESLWSQIESMGRDWTPGNYRPGEAEGQRALQLFYQGSLTEEVLSKAEGIAERAKNRTLTKMLREIRGEWSLMHGEFSQAIEHFSRALVMYRENGFASQYCEARHTLARFLAGNEFDATGEADRMNASSVRGAIAIAELWKALGKPEKAIQFAELAYCSAKAVRLCASRHQLDTATAILSELGASVPTLPEKVPYQEIVFRWEIRVRSLIDTLRSQLVN